MIKLITTVMVMTCVCHGAAFAGDNNRIELVQSSPLGSTSGNTLYVDQSLAQNSVVTGLTVGNGQINQVISRRLAGLGLNTDLAVQSGEGNEATLEINGNGGEIRLLQAANPIRPSAPGQSSGDNVVAVVAASNALGILSQVGYNNSAAVELHAGATGVVTQLGSNLSTDLEVGGGGTGIVTQIGNNSTTPNLVVQPGDTVSYTQLGNNITANSTAVQVISAGNPGNISITQTAW